MPETLPRSCLTGRWAPHSTRRNFVWALAGNVFYGFCQLGMLIVLAQLGDTAMMGQFTLALAICAPVLLLTSLQLRTVQATDARGSFTFSEFLTLRWITLGVAFIGIVLIVVLVGYPLLIAVVVLAMGLAKGLEALSEIYYGLFQQHQRLDKVSISLVIKGVLSLAALALGVHLTGGVLGAVLGLAVAWVLVLVAYDVPVGRSLRTQGEAKRRVGASEPASRSMLSSIKELFLLTMPLGWVALMISLRVNIPRYYVDGMLGESALGLYAALAYFMVAGARVVHSLSQAASARLAQHYVNGDRRLFRQLLSKVALLCVELGVLAILVALFFGETLLTFLFGPEFSGLTNVFTVLMVAVLLESIDIVLRYGMSAARCLKAQAVLLTVSIVAVTALCPVLVPMYGVLGAALALLAAHLLEVVGGMFVMLHVFKTFPNPSKAAQ
jgi:O-antigen/teichoic acid export membrane protein